MPALLRVAFLLLCLPMIACGSSESPAEDTGGGDVAADVSGDASEDATADTDEDAAGDASEDVAADTSEDAEPDSTADTTADVVPDVAPDGGPDATLDADPDIVEDAIGDTSDGGEPICEPGSTREETCSDGSVISCTCQPDGSWTCDGACRDDACDDGSMLACRRLEPTCEDYEIAAIIDGCWECVNPRTCVPWGEPGCRSDIDCDAGAVCDDCATGSCPFCEDCVPGCVDTGCPSDGPLECDATRPECDEGAVAIVRDGCWACVDIETCGAAGGGCEDIGGICVNDAHACTPTMPATRAEGCDRGQQCCAPGVPPEGACDDGSDPLCDIIPPTCTGSEILAAQDSCYRCVNPATCEPWGEPGCRSDMDCDASSWCNDCATGSCDGCLDCVAGCTLHACETEAVLTCRCARPDCGEGNTSVIRDGCWVCVDAFTCADVRGGCE